MASLTWIHLSDFHFDAALHADQEIVLRELLQDIHTCCTEQNLRVDLLFVTGDIAFRGTRAEYAKGAPADRFLAALCERVGLARERLFIVPGNHDACWPLVDRKALAAAKRLRARGGSDAVTRLLRDVSRREQFFRRQRHFRTFSARWSHPQAAFSKTRCWFTVRAPDEVAAQAGRPVWVVGLNSAWLSAETRGGWQDLGGLVIGQEQVLEALRPVVDVPAPGPFAAGGAAGQACSTPVVIALSHHPVWFLAEFDRTPVQNQLMSRAHFLLRGHLHRGDFVTLSAPGRRMVEMAAGSAFSGFNWRNGYNIVRLDFARGHGQIWFRRWAEGGFWTEDNDLWSAARQGTWGWTLAEQRLEPTSAELPQPPNAGPPAVGLDRGAAELPAYVSAAHLLVSRYHLVPFAGRSLELGELDRWVADNRAVAVRLITGPAGVGKTRLLAEWVRRHCAKGGVAGFLSGQLTTGVVDAMARAGHMVAVIDYAETRGGLALLLDKLAELHRHRAVDRHLRVVLLARAAGDWLRALCERNECVSALLADSPPALELEDLVPMPEQREAEFQRAAAAFAKHLDRNPPKTVPDLSDRRFTRVLYLHIAALAAVLDLPLPATELVDGLLGHETHLWVSHAGLEDPKTERRRRRFVADARRVLAVITLRGGVSSMSELDGLLSRLSVADAALVRAMLVDVYPARREVGWLAPLEPDLLGEALVHRVLCDPATAGGLLEAATAGADESTLTHVFTVLGRIELVHRASGGRWLAEILEQDTPRRAAAALTAALALGEHTAESMLGRLLAGALGQTGTLDVAQALDGRVPERTVALREVAAWVEQTLLAALQNDQGRIEERARRLANLATILSTLGRDEEAAVLAQQAVDLYGRLAAAAAEFRPELAASLSNLGSRLGALGHRDEALAATTGALEIYRRLAVTQGDAFLPGLAAGLMNLGGCLSGLGRREEALGATQEAVSSYRRLAEARPVACLADLARSLNNLGNAFSELRRRDEALSAATEALEIYRRLAGTQPDAVLPSLATSLDNVGGRLGECGRSQEAVVLATEAVDIHRRLAEGRPDAFSDDLARSLNNLGNRLSDVGRHEQAVGALQEAVRIRRRLAEKRPDAFLPTLAKCLNNLGVMLGSLGHHEEALAVTHEAVSIFRRLAEARARPFSADLARSLTNLGARLFLLGDREQAGAASTESVSILRELAATSPDAFLPDLAESLTNLAAVQCALGSSQQALGVAQEAVNIHRQLAAAAPDAFLAALAGSLTNLALSLNDIGRSDEALGATREAVDIRRRLADARPDAFLPDLAASLSDFGALLGAVGQADLAVAAAAEAVAIHRRLAELRPDAFLPGVARSLHNLGNRLARLGRMGEALGAIQEAVDLCRRLADTRPDAFLPPLAASLNSLGAIFSGLGRHAPAFEAAREAVDIHGRLAQARPDAFLPGLAMSLQNVGDDLRALGRGELALGATQRAVEIYRHLATARPDAFLPSLAMTLNTQGAILEALGQRGSAVAATEEALDTLWPFFERHPARFAERTETIIHANLELTAGEPPTAQLISRKERLEAVKASLPGAVRSGAG